MLVTPLARVASPKGLCPIVRLALLWSKVSKLVHNVSPEACQRILVLSDYDAKDRWSGPAVEHVCHRMIKLRSTDQVSIASQNPLS